VRHQTPAIVVLASAALLLVGCPLGGPGIEVRGSGDPIAQDRPIRGVHRVDLAMQGTLHIEFGETEGLEVVAEENLQEYIEAEVVGGTLTIRTPSGIILSETEPIEFHLTVVQLNSLQTASSGSIEAAGFEADRIRLAVSSSGSLHTGALQCDNLDIEVSSSGDLSVDSLQAGSVEVDLSSSGNVHIGGGTVQRQDLTLTSSGEYSAPDLASREATLELRSNGRATIRVAELLTADLSSSGDVYYIGEPRLEVESSSSGGVYPAGN